MEKAERTATELVRHMAMYKCFTYDMKNCLPENAALYYCDNLRTSTKCPKQCSLNGPLQLVFLRGKGAKNGLKPNRQVEKPTKR